MSTTPQRLGELGAEYRDPIKAIDWTAADPTLPWLPPEMLSFADQDIQKTMSAGTLRRFSQIEFARFCAAELWLEGLLIRRVMASGFLNTPPAETRVALQEVREEAGHGLMFIEMIDRAGLGGVRLLGDTRLLSWAAHRLDPESAEFWAMVYIGESVTDSFALRALHSDGGGICPLARQVPSLQHKDEARHIAAGHALIDAYLPKISPLRRRLFARSLPFFLRQCLTATLFPTAASLLALRVARPEAVARTAAACPARWRLAEACAAPALKALRRSGLAPSASAGARVPVKATKLQPVFVGSDVYRRAAYGNNHPLAIPRLATVMELCGLLGWLDDGSFRDSPLATAEQLRAFHHPDYIAALRRVDEAGRADRPTRVRYGLGTIENPVFAGMYERAATSVGGSILATELAMDGRVAYHPAGGTHHGRPDRASGFCYFNDPVFAIRSFLDGGLERIYYVDLDAHFGDGVQDAFAEDDRVFTLSIHEAGRWPHAGPLEDRAGGAARNLPVPRGFNDSELAYLMEAAVLPLGRRFAPEAVVVTCGADGLAGDPLSAMALSNLALWQAVEHLAALSPRAVVLGGGGYNPWTVARCWTGLWGRLRGEQVDGLLPPEARELLRGLDSDLIDADEIPETWHTTLVDRLKPGPLRSEVAALAPAVLSP
jgi:acetoin utilization protein AcuC